MWNFAHELQKHGPERPRTNVRGCSLAQARSYCADVTRSHYENFTVASVLLPSKLLPHFHAVYAYCRWADDLADETGERAPALLNWWRRQLRTAYQGDATHPVMIALRETVQKFQIPTKPFLNLLLAFEQDQHKKTYATFDELLGYCRNSANPVGQLVLRLFECFDAERAKLSDEVCTGLQLANFWQDVSRDLSIGRIYIPEEDRRQFDYSDEDFHARQFTPEFRALLEFEVERTRGYFQRGRQLLPLIPKRLRIDIDLFIRGGEAILNAIERIGYNVWKQRPEVSKREKAMLLVRAMGSAIR